MSSTLIKVPRRYLVKQVRTSPCLCKNRPGQASCVRLYVTLNWRRPAWSVRNWRNEPTYPGSNIILRQMKVFNTAAALWVGGSWRRETSCCTAPEDKRRGDGKDLPERSFQLNVKDSLAVRAALLLCSEPCWEQQRYNNEKRSLCLQEHVNWWRALKHWTNDGFQWWC